MRLFYLKGDFVRSKGLFAGCAPDIDASGIGNQNPCVNAM
jgi:hypothetical protein